MPTRVLMPSAAFRPKTENWFLSKSDVEKIHFEWNIQQLLLIDNRHEPKSVEFQEKNLSEKCRLTLNFDKEYLCFTFTGGYKSYRVKMAILNKKMKMVWPREVIVPKLSQTYEVLRVKKELIISNDVLLTDGSLTVCCEIEYVTKEESLSNKDITCTQPINRIDQMATPLEQLFEEYEDMPFSDVTLSVHGRNFQAHKCILASSSKVFEAMFKHPTKEKMTNQVVIEDIQPEVFHQLLRFIYTGRLTSATMETMAARLFAAADKYLLDQLKSECESHLRRQMSADNCLELLLLNDQIHPAEDLKQSAVDFFRRYPSEVMATDGWKKARQEHPNHRFWVLFVEIMENVHRC